MAFPTYRAVRYAVPLREGGSLPAVVDTDGGQFVVKFRGAGQGARALLAELLVGGIAAHLGLPVPKVALIDLESGFGRTEPDPEIQDILKGSHGLNVGLQFLEGAFTYDPVAASDLVSPEMAADIVWLDALVTNIDRTARNPNLLVHDRKLWLIDHGAALYFHHNWDSVTEERARGPFAPIKDHVLLPIADDVAAADERLAPQLTSDFLQDLVASLPDPLLMDAPQGTVPPFGTPEDNRQAYLDYLRARLSAPRAFASEATAAQKRVATSPALSIPYRR